MLSVSVHDSESDLEILQHEWTALLQQSDADTVFVTWEWMCAWWKSYGVGKELQVLEIRDGAALVALVPLYRSKIRKFGLPYTCAHFVGDGSSDSDYLDAIVGRGSEQAVAEALATCLRDGTLRCDLLFLNDVPDASIALRSTRQELARQGWIWSEANVPCTYVELPADWETYLKRLAPRMRTKLRSLTRDLERNGEVRVERCEREEDLPARLEDLFRLHRLRWRGKSQDGVFGSTEKRRFYQEMATTFLSRGWLRFDSLSVSGRHVAHQFCFEYRNTMFLLQEGFDPEWEKQGVGNVLRAHAFRDCIERGVKVYDFLGGVTPHKLSWGGKVKNTVRATTGPRTLKNMVFFQGPKAMTIARQSVKSVLPERVLAWRKSLIN